MCCAVQWFMSNCDCWCLDRLLLFFSQCWSAEYEAPAARGLHPHHPLRLQPGLTGRHGGQGGAEGRRAALEQQTVQWGRAPPPPPLQSGQRHLDLSVLEKVANLMILPNNVKSILCVCLCL